MSSVDSAQPRAEGDLATTPFLHLVLYVFQERATGTLVLRHDGRETKIVFREGKAVAARPVPRGATLQPGLLPLCTLQRARYSFWDADLLKGAPGVTKGTVDPYSFVTESLRAHVRDDAVNTIVDRYMGVSLVLGPRVDVRRLGLRGQDAGLLELMRRGPATPEQLLSQSLMPREHTRRLLYGLMITKCLVPDGSSASGIRSAVTPPNWSGATRHSSAPPAGDDDPSAGRQRSASGRPSAHPGMAAWQRLATLRPPGVPSSQPPPHTAAGGAAHSSAPPPGSIPPRRRTSSSSIAPPPIEQLDDGGKFRRVEQLVANQNFAEASRVLGPLLERHPFDPEYLAMRAWLVFNETNSTTPPPHLISAINDALQADENQVRALYTKGMTLKRAGREQQALRFFKRVAELDPRHLDALRELRLSRMRKGK